MVKDRLKFTPLNSKKFKGGVLFYVYNHNEKNR